jgi:UDP:flavonoid glycosyltransferase YjiC (YdhE family)
MRIVFVPLPLSSHVFPMVPLAWACRAAGHEVRVAVTPAAVSAVTQAGLNAVPMGGSYDLAESIAGLVDRIREKLGRSSGGKGGQQPPGTAGRPSLSADQLRLIASMTAQPYVEATEAMADEMLAFARWWRPDLLVADPAAMVAPLVAEAVGVPVVRHLWGMDRVRQAATSPSGGSMRENLDALLADSYRRFGLAPPDDVTDFGVATVDPCPASIQYPDVPGRIPVRYVPYNGNGSVPDWLMQPASRPRVCVTWGRSLVNGIGGQHLLPEVLAALADTGTEVVIAVKEADRAFLEKVPAGMRIVENMPLNVLLPTCDAVFHHGGFGTMITAAYYGVRQVISPGPTADHAATAERLAGTGAGIYIRPGQADSVAIKAAAAAVLSDAACAAGAARLRAEILAQPPPSAVVAALEGLT